MSVLKTMFAHSLRRRWKGILFVFLCGVAMAVGSAVVNLGAITTEMEAMTTALAESDGAPPSPEQLRTIRDNAAVLALFGGLGILFFFGAMIVGLLMPGGLVANERRSGAIMLWAQHPTPLSSFYARRYLGIQAANLAAQSLFGLMAVLVAFRPEPAATGLGAFVSIITEGTLACAISFALSATGFRRGAFAALAYYLGTSIVGGIFAEGSPLTSGVGERVTAVLPFLLYPSAAVEGMTNGFHATIDWDWGATGIVAYHFALWSVIAWLGLRRIERRPLKL